MSCYVMLAVKVPVTDLADGIGTATLLYDVLKEQPFVEDVYVLNTIPAPEDA